MWKNISIGVESFFGHILYDAGDGHCIRFWHEPWSGHAPLKDLFLDLYACSFLKKLGFLTWLLLHQKGAIGVGIYNSDELFMIGSWRVFVLLLSFFITI